MKGPSAGFCGALCASAALLLTLSATPPAWADGPLRVGSKKFTESVILGEVLARTAEQAGTPTTHVRELGGTAIVWKALISGEIDAYVEYTGTLREEILGGRVHTDAELPAALAAEGVLLGANLGFDDTYALGMSRPVAERLGLRTISELARHPEVRLGLSNEFLDRKDGWPGLAARYGLPHSGLRGLDHDLAYRGLQAGDVDVVDLYSTDAEIRFYDLVVLADDRGYFPEYRAVIVHRRDVVTRAPAVVAAWTALGGTVPADVMVRMNARAKLERVPEGTIAAEHVAQVFGGSSEAAVESRASAILRTTREHLVLVGISLLAALVVAIPLGVLAAKRRRVGQVVLGLSGIVQTIPSLALLVVLIPLFGLGDAPAIVALGLYSLLPIVRGTHAGLVGLSTPLRESADALGLSFWGKLRHVELPLAAGSILAGVKTAAVIDVGLATLGALVGAGGYGQPILTGIRLDRVDLILQGAVPAAALALIVQALFDAVERWLVPRW